MNREKQIEEIADKMVAVCDDCNECHYGKKYGYGTCTEHQMAERIYEAGYRKADEVRKETLKEVYKQLIDNLYWGRITDEKIDEIFKEKFGIEVNE